MVAAKQLQELKPVCPIVIDNMSNAANRWFGAMPERLFIIQDGIVVYVGEAGPFGYHVNEVKNWLKKYVKS